MPRRNLSLLLTVLLVSIVCHDRSRQNPYARFVADGYEKIDDWALEPPADEELVAGAMRGMVDVLRRRGDEHSRYLRPRAAKQLMEELSGDFGGVGVRIRIKGEPPRLTVIGPPEPRSPAARGGVRADDYIVAIDGAPTGEMTMQDVLDRMRGAKGEPVTLELERGTAGEGAPPESISVTLVREIIRVPSVIGDRRQQDGEWIYRLDQDQRIALVRLTTFGDHTASELAGLLPKLSAQGVRAVVLDLRDNSGGALQASVDICSLFLPEGKPIVETRGRDREVIERFTSSGGPFTDLPLAVLVNGNTASASEITAACLQDNGRAVVIGERSFGKGTVQRIVPLGIDDAMLKLTFASYWRPSGVNIHRRVDTPDDADWGVSPDPGYELELSDEEHAELMVARAERDLIPVEPPGDHDAASEGEGHHSEDSHAQGEAQGEFVDGVLDRAVEYLQSLLDASVSNHGAASPGRAG